MNRPDYAVFVGLDVGKQEHHACGLDPDGNRVHDHALPQDETKLRELFATLAQRGRVLVVIDQPATIGAMAVTVARATGIDVAYLPGLAMRRIADLHPGNAKTDARDAYVIAEAARSMPHALRRVDTGDETLADLEVIVGFDDDLAAETTRVTNRIRGAAHPDPPGARTRDRRPAAPQGGAAAAVPVRRTHRATRRRAAPSDRRGQGQRGTHPHRDRGGDHGRARRADRHRSGHRRR